MIEFEARNSLHLRDRLRTHAETLAIGLNRSYGFPLTRDACYDACATAVASGAATPAILEFCEVWETAEWVEARRVAAVRPE